MTRSLKLDSQTEPVSHGRQLGRERATARRPPAITPLRLLPQSNHSQGATTPGSIIKPALPADMPPVVLRIPDVATIASAAQLTDLLPKRSGKRRLKLIAIAIVLGLLIMMLFGGKSKKKIESPGPTVLEAPAWSVEETPVHQPIPTWQAPVASLPPTSATPPEESGPTLIPPNQSLNSGSTVTPGERAPSYPETGAAARNNAGDRYPGYRVSDQRMNYHNLPQGNVNTSPPPVSFDRQRIEKLPAETHYDGIGSGPY